MRALCCRCCGHDAPPPPGAADGFPITFLSTCSVPGGCSLRRSLLKVAKFVSMQMRADKLRRTGGPLSVPRTGRKPQEVGGLCRSPCLAHSRCSTNTDDVGENARNIMKTCKQRNWGVM